MKINDKIISYDVSRTMGNLSGAGSEKIEKEKLPVEHQVQSRAPQEGDAIVHLSQATKEAKAIREVIAALPDVREEKVTLLRQKIESGTYAIDYEGVAEKLLSAFWDDLI